MKKPMESVTCDPQHPEPVDSPELHTSTTAHPALPTDISVCALPDVVGLIHASHVSSVEGTRDESYGNVPFTVLALNSLVAASTEAAYSASMLMTEDDEDDDEE